MKIKCNIITPKMKKIAEELETKDSLVCNAVSLWQTKNQTVEFPTREQIKEIITKEKDLDLAILNYTLVKFEGNKLAYTDKNNNIFLYDWYKSNTSDYFFSYITGNIESPTSQQKKEVFNRLEKEGYTLDRIKEILSSNKLINTFLLYHEMSHVQNNDRAVYWGEDRSNKDLMSEDKIQIEYRATLDALQKIEKYKKLIGDTSTHTQENIEKENRIITPIKDEFKGKLTSGTSKGYNTYWKNVAKAYGVEIVSVDTLSDTERSEAQAKTMRAARKLNRTFPMLPNSTRNKENTDKANNNILNAWSQIKDADTVFVVGKILGYYKNTPESVEGINGWAVQMAIDENKQVYVFNIKDNKWYEYKTLEGFIQLDESPTLTNNFAGLGDINTTEEGRKAIRDLFKHSFGVEKFKESNIIGDEGNVVRSLFGDVENIPGVDRKISKKAPSKIIEEQVPKVGEIISTEKENVFTKVLREFNPIERKDRVELIARKFSEIVDILIEDKIQEYSSKFANATSTQEKLKIVETLKLYNDSVKGRQAAIQELTVGRIFNSIREEFESYTQLPVEELEEVYGKDKGQYIIDSYKKILDNFEALVEEACLTIENTENIRVVIERIIGSNIEGSIQKTELENEEKESNTGDDTEGNRVDGNGGWSFKVRMVDPYTSLSRNVKKVVSSIAKEGLNGELELDDLGNIRYLNSEYVHAVLINELSRMIEPSDFVTKNEDGSYRLPALEALSKKYSWVNQIISSIESDPNLVSSFYSNFRKDFIPYTSYLYSNKDEKWVFKNLNESVAESSTKMQIINNYELGTIIDVDSVYTTANTINKNNAILGVSIIDDVLPFLKEEDISEEDAEYIVSSLDKALKMAGVNSSESIILNVLNSENGINNIELLSNSLKHIFTDLNDLKDGTHIIDYFKDDYNTIASIVGEVSELDQVQSFRQGKDSYYSYSAPNYVDTMLKYFKLEDTQRREQYLDNEFRQYDWFYNRRTGEYRNKLLEMIALDENVRWNLHIQDMNMIDDRKYTDWGPKDIATSFVRKYFSAGYNTGAKTQYGYYNFPIFADSPVVKFIKLPRFTGNYKEQLLPLFREVVYQELERRKLVFKRRKLIDSNTNNVLPIAGFDSNGHKFHFFPELNDLHNGEMYFFEEIENAISNENLGLADDLIDKTIKYILNTRFEEFINNLYIEKNDLLVEALIEEGAIKSIEGLNPALEEYFWNHTYMTSQLIQLTTTDLAFYKDAIDFQKRYKEIYAAGTKLNTLSKYGKEIQRTIYLTDQIITSSSLSRIRVSINNAIKEGRISKEEGDSIIEKFYDINVTDAQAYRTLDSMRAVLDMMGAWTEEMEQAMNRFENNEWDMADMNIVWQTLKPFLFTQISKPNGFGGNIKVPHHNKNSEFLLLSIYEMIASSVGSSPKMRALNQFMLDNNIDVAEFESAVKVGGQGTIELNYSTRKLNDWISNNTDKAKELEDRLGKPIKDATSFKDANDALVAEGKISIEEYNSRFEYIELDYDEALEILNNAIRNEDGTENKQVIHELPYRDYVIAQPTPEHLFDVEAVFGSQFRNLIISDLPNNFSITINGISYDKKQTIDLYQSLIVENLLENYADVKKKFTSIEDLQKYLLSQVKGNPKYGRDIINALQLVEIVNPITGIKEKVFNIPLYSPNITNKLQELITSIFKNNITKQYIKGGACTLVSNFGYTDALHVLHNEDGSIKGVECYLPAYSKQFYKEFLVDSEDGTYQYLDINKMPGELRKIVGYRIPTEDKYSMLPLIIKGFLPQQNGSSIMLPAEITTLSGADFDIDKLFLMIPEFRMVKVYDIKKAWSDFYKQNTDITPKTEDTIRKDRFSKWFESKKDSYFIKEKPEKIKYNESKEVKNNPRAARNNMLIDISYAILTHKDTAEKIHNPGNYDKAKKAARIVNILGDKELLEEFIEQNNVTKDKVYSALKNSSLNTLNDFIKGKRKSRNPMLLDTFIYNHNQNMTGGSLIGVYANNTSMQAKYQAIDLAIADNYTFSINGRIIKDLSNITSELGERISKLCANFSASSVDNVKDPVLADLMQNRKTAKIAGLLVRAGLSIDEISLLFTQPLVKQCFIETGSLDRLKVYAENAIDSINDLGGRYNIPSYFDTNDDILSSTIIDSYYFDDMSDDEKIEYLSNTVDSALLMHRISKIADDLSGLTAISRADSPNGAIEITLAGARIQSRKVDIYHESSKNETFSLSGINKVIKNDIITNRMSIDDIRERLLKSPMPMLQAFYSLGIDSARNIMAPYFIQYSPEVEDKALQLFKFSKNGIFSSNVLNIFYNDLVTFGMSETSLFGNDTSLPETDVMANYTSKRDWYLNEFPEVFKSIVSKNKDIAQLNIIKKLGVNNGVIIMGRSGRLTSLMRESLMRDFDQLLYMDNPKAQELAIHLFRYSFYKDGFRFGANSFGNFFSTGFINSFPEYTETIRNLKYKIKDPKFLDNFISQFYANRYNLSELLPNISARDISFESDNSGAINVETRLVRNKRDDRAPFPMIVVDGNLFTIDSQNSGKEIIRYVPAIVINDGNIKYNALESVEEMYDKASTKRISNNEKINKELTNVEKDEDFASFVDSDLDSIDYLVNNVENTGYDFEDSIARLENELC